MNSDIFKKAIISEKSFGKAAEGKFTFIVDKRATKDEISETAAELFSVKVLAVNVANIQGKIKRSKKGYGKRSDYKKATLTLKKGDTIDLFEIEKPEEKAEKKKKEAKKVEAENSDTTVKVREKKK